MKKKSKLIVLIIIALFASLVSVNPISATSFCPNSIINPRGSEVSTLSHDQGIHYLPADGSGISITYSSQLQPNETPAIGIVLSLYRVNGGRIAYRYSYGANPVSLTYNFQVPGSYYFVKNLVYLPRTVCTAYFNPENFRPVCGVTDLNTGANSSNTTPPENPLNLVDYSTCSCLSNSALPYCREALNHVSLGSAEKFLDIRLAQPTNQATISPTNTPTLTPTRTPSATPSPTSTLAPTPTSSITSGWWQQAGGLHFSYEEVRSNPDLQSPPKFLINTLVSSNPQTAGLPMCGTDLIVTGNNYSEYQFRLSSNPHISSLRPRFDHCNIFNYSYFKELLTKNRPVSTLGSDITISEKSSLIAGVTIKDDTYYKVFESNVLFAPRISSGSTWEFYPNMLGGGIDKFVFLIEGNATFSNPTELDELIRVNPNAFLAFIVRGNIIINSNVGKTSFTQAGQESRGVLEGFYFTDGDLIIRSVTDDIPQGDINTEKQFVGAGSFIGCGTVHLNRSFPDQISYNFPTELFIYRPDLLFSVPKAISSPTLDWKEL